jgi:hypothetical protein
MLAILYLMVGGAMMLVLVVLAVVVVGIRQEPSAKELSSRAPSVTTAWVRRLLGVYVRKPGQPPAFEDRGEPPITASNPPAGLTGSPNEGCRQSCLEAQRHHSEQQVSLTHTDLHPARRPRTQRR